MKIAEIASFLESWAPLALQESYDNCGLQVGNAESEIEKALITIDVTEEVVDEAIAEGCGLIISHHPVIFGALKKLTGANMVERIVAKALKNNIALYTIHTNLDNVNSGVNAMIAQKLGLTDTKILESKKGLLRKMIVFVPYISLADGRQAPQAVREAIWQAGGGNIGQYSQCSFNTPGTGTFLPLEGANPTIGKVGELEHAQEEKIEVIYPYYKEGEIKKAIRAVHPYETAAFDILPMTNAWQEVGAGMIGTLPEAMEEKDFLQYIKQLMEVQCVRYSPFIHRKISRVAVCGGSGSFLLSKAIAEKADAFVTADFKYHQFFEAEGRILIADIGHYESEQFTAELLHNRLSEKFRKFALLISKVYTNPINYS